MLDALVASGAGRRCGVGGRGRSLEAAGPTPTSHLETRGFYNCGPEVPADL